MKEIAPYGKKIVCNDSYIKYTLIIQAIYIFNTQYFKTEMHKCFNIMVLF